MENKIKIVLVGAGYWGNNLLRNLATHPKCHLLGVCDGNSAHLEKVQSQYPHIPVFNDFSAMLERSQPQAVVIATPPDSHSYLAIEALNFGTHVLVEKPLATSTEECAYILKAADKANKIVMVDNTLLFYQPVVKLIEIVRNGDLGDLLYYDSTRVNFGGFQTRANVLWDLAPHEISILDLLTDHEVPEQIVAVGAKHFGSTTESMCYLNLKYRSGLNAHLNLNWAAPIKFRQMIVGGTKQMAVLNDTSINDKVRIYDKSVNLINGLRGEFTANYHTGSVTVPEVKNREALHDVISEFTSAIFEGRKVSSDAFSGARVVKILEAATKSLEQNGKPEYIHWNFDHPIKRTG